MSLISAMAMIKMLNETEKELSEMNCRMKKDRASATVDRMDFCGELCLFAEGLIEKAKPKWIPVTERLPEEDGNFLVHKNLFGTSYITAIRFAKDGEKVCKYDLAKKKNVWYDYDSETGYFACDTVTHWMPLPEPPK